MGNNLVETLEKIVSHVKAKFLKKAKSSKGLSNIDAPEKIMGISKEKYLMAKIIERISEIDIITSTNGSAKHAHLKVNDIVGLTVLLDGAISDNKELNREPEKLNFDENIKRGNYQVFDDDGEID